MIKAKSGENSLFDKPGNYRIRIQGYVDEKWSERLAGMRINTTVQEDQVPVTTLVGLLPDQAALSGVLNILYELHLTLLSVEMLEEEKYSLTKEE